MNLHRNGLDSIFKKCIYTSKNFTSAKHGHLELLYNTYSKCNEYNDVLIKYLLIVFEYTNNMQSVIRLTDCFQLLPQTISVSRYLFSIELQ